MVEFGMKRSGKNEIWQGGTIVFVLIMMFITACPKTVRQARYDFEPPDREWTPYRAQNGALLFRQEETQRGIMVYTTCDRYQTAPLEPLSRDLFIGFQNKRIVEQGSAQVAGREAHYIIMECSLEGTPVRVKAYTFHAKECVYDIAYFSPPENFDSGLETFESFVKNFKADE